jgi:hypothetical protein
LKALSLYPLPDGLVVAQLPPDASFRPKPQPGSGLWAEIYTPDEITIICSPEAAPQGARIEPGWRALKIVETLDFNLVGVLAEISTLLAKAGVSIFVLSTYNTDYILLKEQHMALAIASLRQAGHSVLEHSS